MKDWLSSNTIKLMTREARGTCIGLMARCWDNGAKLPIDPETLRVLEDASPDEWGRIWPQLAGFFPVVRGRYRSNLKMLMQFREQQAFRKSKSEQGRAGAKAKWANRMNGTAIVSPMANSSSSSSSSSASALKDLKPADASPIPRRFRGKAGKELVRERIAEHFDNKKETEDRHKIQAMHERIVREQAAEIMKHVAPVTH